MNRSDDEALTFIRALLGSAARPDAPDPPDVESDADLRRLAHDLFAKQPEGESK